MKTFYWFVVNHDQHGKGHLWREGKLCLRSRLNRSEIDFAWSHRLRPGLAFSLTVGSGDGDTGLGLHLELLGLSWWLHIEHEWTKRLCHRLLPHHYFRIDEPRQIQVYISGCHVHWSFWQPLHEWSTSTPKWRQGGFFLEDVLLGSARYSKRLVDDPVDAIASFPEGSYRLKLQREIATWKRPRWPWPIVRESVDIRLERDGAIPQFRGKGENSYDCDDDAIFGMGSEGHSYEHAVATYVEAVLRNRRKYGHVRPEDRAILSERKA